MIKKKITSFFLVIAAVVALICPSGVIAVSAASGPSITTTLTDGMIQKGSKKTFDVWAKNAGGTKIIPTVKFNGQEIKYNWDDSEKTSYTLTFEKEGTNTVVVSATDQGKTTSLTYQINYQKAKKGDVIGQATWSIELFTIGGGYLVEPVERDIMEGENAAQELVKLLHDNGYVTYYGGSLPKAFYMSYIGDGDQQDGKESYRNSYQDLGKPKSPKKLGLKPNIPTILDEALSNDRHITFYDKNDYKNSEGYIGEFVFSNGSGWMYSLNHVFPNVGFSDSYLSDGDVVRVQFTLAYGNDIGGGEALESGTNKGYYTVANKDRLTALLAKTRASSAFSKESVRSAYQAAVKIAATVNASQNSVDAAYNILSKSLKSNGVNVSIPQTSQNSSNIPSAVESREENEQSPQSALTGNQSNPFIGGNEVSSTVFGNVSDSLETNNSVTGSEASVISSSAASSVSAIIRNTSNGWVIWLIVILVIILFLGGGTVLFFHLRKKDRK